MSKTVLEIKNIVKGYNYEGGRLEVLKGADLTITEGEMLAITGTSGSGKTTLLNTIATIISADSGDIFFDQKNISDFNEDQRADFRLQNIGIIFQQHHLLPQCTAWENVLMPTINSRTKPEDLERYATELFQRAGIADRMHHFPGQLSGGECQRVAVIRALINRPSLLLADEPTGALDKNSTENLLNLLQDFNRDGMTIIMVTHSDYAADKMNRKIKLNDGKLSHA